MTTQKEHFAYAVESAFGGYVTPTKGYIVRTGDNPTKRTYDTPEETGAGRSVTIQDPLEKVVSLSLNASARPQNFLSLMATMFRGVTSTIQGAGPAYRHKLLPDDALELGSISAQMAHSNGVTRALKGAVARQLRIIGEAKAVTRWELDMVVKDSAIVGGTWADGSAAPATAVAFDSLYSANLQPSLAFYQGSLLLGGTKALTTGEIVVTGASAQAGVRRAQIQIDFNTEADDFNVTTDYTINSAQAAKRNIEVSIDMDVKVAGAFFTAAHLSNDDVVLQLDFTGPIIAATFPWLLRVTLPKLKVTDAPQAPIDGNQGLKRTTITMGAMADPSLTGSPDIGMVLQNTDVTAA